jgi:tetratricopeptide (TPR) repeat protein
LLGQGAENTAESHLMQALRIAPNHLAAHEMLATFYLRKDRWLEAKPVLAEWARLAPNELAAHLNLGTALLQLKDPSGAAELRRALEIEPRQIQALNNLARFYLTSRQQLPEALALSQRLVALQPKGASYDLLGWALFSNGKTNEALKAAAEAVAKEPANPTYRQRYERLMQVAGSIP